MGLEQATRQSDGHYEPDLTVLDAVEMVVNLINNAHGYDEMSAEVVPVNSPEADSYAQIALTLPNGQPANLRLTLA